MVEDLVQSAGIVDEGDDPHLTLPERAIQRQGFIPPRDLLRGARTHNLKNINLDLPRNHLTVIAGLSGSGKSSLAFVTLYAEGQRRYVESLSAYARQFLISWKCLTWT